MNVADQIQERLAGSYPSVLGLRLTEASADVVKGEIDGRDELCTVPGMTHGGVIMGLADTLGGIATMLNLPEGAHGTTTIESKTNFFRAVPTSGKILGECTALHKGKTTQVWQTRITGEDGRLAALVTQTQIVLGG